MSRKIRQQRRTSTTSFTVSRGWRILAQMKLPLLLILTLASSISCSYNGWTVEPKLSGSVSATAEGVRLDVDKVRVESASTSYHLGVGATATSPRGARIRASYSFPIDAFDRFGKAELSASWRF